MNKNNTGVPLRYVRTPNPSVSDLKAALGAGGRRSHKVISLRGLHKRLDVSFPLIRLEVKSSHEASLILRCVSFSLRTHNCGYGGELIAANIQMHECAYSQQLRLWSPPYTVCGP